MPTVRCAHCGRVVPANPRTKNQTHCGREACQKDRKRMWQRKKMAEDCDYKANQKECARLWRENNRLYWKQYRKRHTESAECNRIKQRERNRRRRKGIAKMDSLDPVSQVSRGTYYLIPAEREGIAKMDPLGCKITVILMPCGALAHPGEGIAKEEAIDPVAS